MDFSRYPASGRYYTGAERKKGILINGETYIVKYAKDSPEGKTFSHVSEYLGSHLFEHAGLETQQTMLGTCGGCDVVVMKDFISEQETFVPFNAVGDSSLEQDRERYTYGYEDIIRMLQENEYTTPITEVPSYRNSGIIKAVTEDGEKIQVGRITYESFENEEF